jgi:DUF2075 family protein
VWVWYFFFKNVKMKRDPTARARSDKSISGYKRLLQTDPDNGSRLVDKIIKNTYKTLMTRGMRGCYVYCMDKALEEHLRASLASGAYRESPDHMDLAAEGEQGGD